MNEENEYIYALKRYLNKVLKYKNKREMNEFINDEMAFDATLYCIEMISEISSILNNNKEIKARYTSINFNELTKIKDNLYKDENINITYLESLIEIAFPRLLYLLIANDESK